MPMKFLVLEGGGVLGFLGRGGGSAKFIFMGAGIFLRNTPLSRDRCSNTPVGIAATPPLLSIKMPIAVQRQT